jgi:hypothetical protein
MAPAFAHTTEEEPNRSTTLQMAVRAQIQMRSAS